MEFDKSKVYSVLNAEELHKGDRVIVADTFQDLKYKVKSNAPAYVIEHIANEDTELRFEVRINPGERIISYGWAYLVNAAAPLKWTDLKLGDRIRKGNKHAIVTVIDGDDREGIHIAAGCIWICDENLVDWEREND